MNYNLPNSFNELEYLESSGTQFIDTGVYITSNNVVFKTKLNLLNALTSVEQDVFGNQDQRTNRLILLADRQDSVWALYTRSGSAPGSTKATLPFSINTVTTIESHILNNQKWIVVDGVSSDIQVSTDVNNTNKTIQLFSNGNGDNPFKGRIYYFQIYQDDVLVFNGIPAKRKSDNVVGMYDTVSETFRINVGTGEFIAGDVINRSNYDIFLGTLIGQNGISQEAFWSTTQAFVPVLVGVTLFALGFFTIMRVLKKLTNRSV